jgi:hypothetical protein
MAGTLGWRRCILQTAATGQSPRHRPTAPPPPERSAPTRPSSRAPSASELTARRGTPFLDRQTPNPFTLLDGSRGRAQQLTDPAAGVCMTAEPSGAADQFLDAPPTGSPAPRSGEIALAGTGFDLVVEGLADHVAVAVDAVGSSIALEHLQVGPGCRWSCWRYRCSADGG